ncbi:hypothetical protein HK097_005965 [Rhizophlyctis rosea]|uniref:Uncharacterized protein n=1 Tax=Rhizophlyctis rosea TaxID=64517 RepID=A0AAD5X607_9FUNG|nr:hypothetical protein HK097_005965 [Rhizophlyctis rosea]
MTYNQSKVLRLERSGEYLDLATPKYRQYDFDMTSVAGPWDTGFHSQSQWSAYNQQSFHYHQSYPSYPDHSQFQALGTGFHSQPGSAYIQKFYPSDPDQSQFQTPPAHIPTSPFRFNNEWQVPPPPPTETPKPRSTKTSTLPDSLISLPSSGPSSGGTKSTEDRPTPRGAAACVGRITTATQLMRRLRELIALEGTPVSQPAQPRGHSGPLAYGEWDGHRPGTTAAAPQQLQQQMARPVFNNPGPPCNRPPLPPQTFPPPWQQQPQPEMAPPGFYALGPPHNPPPLSPQTFPTSQHNYNYDQSSQPQNRNRQKRRAHPYRKLTPRMKAREQPGYAQPSEWTWYELGYNSHIKKYLVHREESCAKAYFPRADLWFVSDKKELHEIDDLARLAWERSEKAGMKPPIWVPKVRVLDFNVGVARKKLQHAKNGTARWSK